ncbi:tetratricopeptide repeat protein 22-like [Asterias amurensis]|uniref:tetratricopeptide repeat protein 22-like n=1 Tax=Asterias amurensis TaxID=7602 RepID=UPI003AB4335E
MEAHAQVSPGLFDLPLPINDKNIDTVAVQRKLLDVEHDLKSRLDRPEEIAILNLLGVLKFSLKRFDDALEDFRAALQKDPDNLNAMANMQHVLTKLYRMNEAKIFQSQLEGWNVHAAEGAASVQVLDPADQTVIKARSRCLAEQAYMFAAADIHTDDASNERYQQSNQIFKQALVCAGEAVDTPERDFWEFMIAKNANKLFTSFTYKEDRKKTQDYLEESVQLFYGITQRSPGDPEYQWESWRNMADIFRRINLTKHLSHSLDQLKELRHYIESDPEECMKKAMEISPDNPRLLARYANFVYSLKRDTCTKRALDLLDRSISLDDSDYNFYAFSTRATIRLKSYQWKLRKSEEDSTRCTPPKLELLEMASADLEKAIAFRNTSWNLMALADVCCHKVKHYPAGDPSQRKCIEKALDLLAQAEECNDQTQVLKNISRSRGRIFFDVGEYREAIRCHQMAVHHEPDVTTFTGYYHELFRSYLCLMKSKPEDDIFQEMADSLRKAINKYGGGKLISHCFGRLRNEYINELRLFTEFCVKIVDNEGLLYVLESKEPPSPLTPPKRQGGTLEKVWSNTPPSQQGTIEHVGANPTQPHRLKASSKVNLMDRFKSPSSEPPEIRGNRNDVGSTAVVGGTNTPEEDEGIAPLSGIRCTNVSSGQEPPGSRSDVRLAASQSEGSDTHEEEERGIASLVSGFGGMEIRVSSGQDVKEPGAQSQPPAGSPSGAVSPEKDKKFLYDFYVAHGESDEKWVEDTLLHELMTVRDLRGCTYKKDADLGSYLYSVKLDLMKQCACILVLHGEDFKDGQYLVQHILKLKKECGEMNVIPIERDGLSVPDELSVMTSFNASAERVDWNRLAQSIKNTKGAPSYNMGQGLKQ